MVIQNSKYEKFADKIHHNHQNFLWSLDFKNSATQISKHLSTLFWWKSFMIFKYNLFGGEKN